NNSDNEIKVQGFGITKIPAQSSVIIPTNETVKNLFISSNDMQCLPFNVEKETNSTALVLDIFPGVIFGVIPLLVDAVSENLTTYPSSFVYTCNK
ncbi:MAG: hypothetical protein IJ638_02210, partial [Alphaproteobacteria bacterium]|nr:hypothetical protein [Alphaproteobacteria bacterium]